MKPVKKIAVLLALLLSVAGCQTIPAVAPVSSDAESASSSQVQSQPSDTSAPESSVPEGWQFKGGAANDAPKPETPPAETVGAIDLPATLFVSTAGLSLEQLTPAQYDFDFSLNRGGFRNFLDCDYFRLRENGKYAIANPNGKIVTGFDFTVDDGGWYTPFDDAIAPVTKDGKQGAVNVLDGSLVVPMEYDSVWPVRGGKLIECTKDDEILLVDYEGNVQFTLDRGDTVLGMKDTMSILQNGTLKFFSQKDFSPIANFGADEVSYGLYEGRASENRVIFGINGKYGLCDGEGKILAEPTADEMRGFSGNGEYIAFMKNGKWGVMDRKGKTVCKPEWDDLVIGENSASVSRDGLWGVIGDLDSGKPAVQPAYDYVTPFKNEYAVFERNGRYGLIDREGNELLTSSTEEPQLGGMYETAPNLDKGYILFGGDNGPGNFGIMTIGGKVIVSSENYVQLSQEGDKYNLIMTPQEKWGYLDRKGQFVIDAKFDDASIFLKGKDVAFVKKNGKICLIDRKGNVVLETVFSDMVGYHPETMVCAMEYTNEKGQTKGCLVKLNLKS